MKYVIDIDGTICSPTVGRDYESAKPWQDRIDTINKLYDDGNTITSNCMVHSNGGAHK